MGENKAAHNSNLKGEVTHSNAEGLSRYTGTELTGRVGYYTRAVGYVGLKNLRQSTSAAVSQ